MATYGDIGGRCLDGSMAGYYYGRPAENVNSQLWVIHLQGGGACHDREYCEKEAEDVATSNGWGETWQPIHERDGDFLTTDTESNPRFADAHHVRVPYCTEDTHAGQVVAPTDGCDASDPNCVDQWGLYFSGHLNFKNILHHILSHELASQDMTQILLTGNSAGAAGVLHNCDFLQDFLNEFFGVAQVQVSCVPVGGFFFPGFTADHADTAQAPSTYADFSATPPMVTHWDEMTPHINALWQKYLPSTCTNHASFQDEPWKCGTATAIYQAIQRPTFVVQNQFDKNWLGFNLGMPVSHHKTCPGQRFMQYVGSAMNATVSVFNDRVTAGHNDGLFLASCLDHGEGIQYGFDTLVKGFSSKDAINSWFFDAGVPRVLQDDCESSWGGPCNPSCDGWPGFSSFEHAQLSQCCADALEESCGVYSTENECLNCANQNQQNLGAAGCNEEGVRALCAQS